MPNLRNKTWTSSTPANVEDAQHWEDHLLPNGGTTGQVLTKTSDQSQDATWEDPASSGHTIQNASGTDMPYQEVLQFVNAEVSNDSSNNRTVVDCQGEKGDPGDAATIAVGTVTTLPAGSSATVTNSGTSSAAVFDFGIPKGVDGSGAVSSVNGKTGNVVLDASDVGAQAELTFDNTPTANSNNPVKSGGIYSTMAHEIVRTGVTITADTAIRIPAGTDTDSRITTSSTVIPICGDNNGVPVKYKSMTVGEGYVSITPAESAGTKDIGVVVINQ